MKITLKGQFIPDNRSFGAVHNARALKHVSNCLPTALLQPSAWVDNSGHLWVYVVLTKLFLFNFSLFSTITFLFDLVFFVFCSFLCDFNCLLIFRRFFFCKSFIIFFIIFFLLSFYLRKANTQINNKFWNYKPLRYQKSTS